MTGYMCLIFLSWTLGIIAEESDPDLFRDTTGLLESRDYQMWIYDVVTKDGYILELHRVPFPKSSRGPINREPILLHHGMGSSSSDFLLNQENSSMGYFLADQGYDVWMINVRGNTYSRRHLTLDPNSKEFWKFSMDEMGLFDLPSTIDFILEETQRDKILFLGYSVGGVTPLILLSSQTEYNKKIKLAVLVAPVVFWNDDWKRPYYWIVQKAVRRLKEPVALGQLQDNIICKYFPCLKAMPLSHLPHINHSRYEVYHKLIQGGTSISAMIHLLQYPETGKFHRYIPMKGPDTVFEILTEPKPIVTKADEYNLTEVTAPVVLFWSHDDEMVGSTAVSKLKPKLKNLVLAYDVDDGPLTRWGHKDFGWACDSLELFLIPLLNTLNRYRGDATYDS